MITYLVKFDASGRFARYISFSPRIAYFTVCWMCSYSLKAHCYTRWRTLLAWWSAARGHMSCIYIQAHECACSFPSTFSRSLHLALVASISRIAVFLTVLSDQSVVGCRKARIWHCCRSLPGLALTRCQQRWSFGVLRLATKVLRFHLLCGRVSLPHSQILWSTSWLWRKLMYLLESHCRLSSRFLPKLCHYSY